MGELVRAFFALPVRDGDKLPLVTAQDRMKRAALHTRVSPSWIGADKLHVTLKFLGHVPSDAVEALLEAGARRAREHSVFTPTWKELTGFGSVRRARVLVAALDDPHGRIERLVADLDDDVAPLGVERESRHFKPHVTLARIKRPTSIERLVEVATLEPVPVVFDELRLYRSELRREGSVYTALGAWPLRSPEGAAP